MDHNIFAKIDTEEKAYWLGFIIADGSIQVRNTGQCILKLSCAIKDLNHLKKFKKFIGTQNKIYIGWATNGKTLTKSQYCEISVTSKSVIKDLKALGVRPKKSFSVNLPYLDNSELERHMIRGIWDGDGTVRFAKRARRNKIIPEVQLCGNYFIVKSINNILCSKLNLQPSKLSKISSIYLFRKTNTPAKEICDYLYTDCNIYLDRKYKKAIQALTYFR